MPEESAPPVVAVVVSHDPGPWLESCLESLREQDYPNLSVLVVDAASHEELAARVARVAPQFFFRRLEENRGFGPSANCVRGVVEGATHLVFCHDDVLLAPDAIRRMVEEAFRQNAGIVGPKLVDPDEPDRILQLGLGVDRFGSPVRRVEHREFDQAQHDEVQETFAVPGGCTLVRADLFEAIGGFDEEISMFGEDIDLCWRARLAGARAFVVPLAVVGHLEATSSRKRELREARALQWRHELRVVLKNYGRLRRGLVVAELVLWSLIEAAYFAAIGRGDRVRQVRDAWRWNLQRSRGLAEARDAVAEIRRISDFELRSLFTRRTSRVLRFLQPRFERTLIAWSTSSRSGARRELERLSGGSHRSRRVNALAIVLGVVLLFGARSLLFGHLPVLGGYLPLPSPGTLLGRYFGGEPGLGLGKVAPGSPALLVLGLLGIVTLGAMGVALKVLLIASIAAGAFGVARLLRPFGGSAIRLVGAGTYLFLPLAWNDVATGDVVALTAYAAAPFVLSRILRATGTAPFSSVERPTDRRGIGRELIGFSLVLALFGSFAPAVAIVAPALAAAVGLGCAALGSWRAGVRTVLVTLGSLLGAFVLAFPWSLSFIGGGASIQSVLGASPDPNRAPQLGAVMRLELGPYGAGLLGLALFVAALFVLVAARADRYRVALAVWFQLLSSIVIVWAATEGWLGSGGGALRLLAAPIACAIAVEVGLGAAVVAEDVVGGHFGWRHLMSFGFVAVATLGLLPMLGATLPGRFKVPVVGDESVLGWIQPPARAAVQRVLYVGDAHALPGFPVSIGNATAALVASPAIPDALSLYPGGNVAAIHGIESAIDEAETGSTIELGSALAAFDVRYLVVPTSAAPALSGEPDTEPAPPPQQLLDALTAQADLHELPNEAGVLIFENTAWTGRVPLLGRGFPAPLRVLGVLVEDALLVLLAGKALKTRRRRRQMHHARHTHAHAASAHEGAEPDAPAVLAGERS